MIRLSSQCLSGTCAVNVGSSPIETPRHAGVGFLDGFNTDAGVPITPQDTQLVEALHPRQWRLGDARASAVASSAWPGPESISLDLTADWEDWAGNFYKAAYNKPYLDLSELLRLHLQQRQAADRRQRGPGVLRCLERAALDRNGQPVAVGVRDRLSGDQGGRTPRPRLSARAWLNFWSPRRATATPGV